MIKSEKGTSLVELILVVVIVGFIILLLSNLPSTLKLIGDSKNNSLVREIVSKKIEGLRLQTYDNLANGSATFLDPRLSSLNSATATQNIEDCPLTICTNGELIKKVTVTVTWLEGGKPRKLEMDTLIAKGGLK